MMTKKGWTSNPFKAQVINIVAGVQFCNSGEVDYYTCGLCTQGLKEENITP